MEKGCCSSSNNIGLVSMAKLFASTVTRIHASRQTMAGTATYLLQSAWKFLSRNLTGLNQTDYASV